MRYSLQGYFDTGLSYGLADDAFPGRTAAMVPDILKIGIRNPLGLGVRRRVDREDPDVIPAWRHHALAKVDDPEMDLGYGGPAADTPAGSAALEGHKAALRAVIEGHTVGSCEVTVYAVGVAFLRLDFAPGVPADLLQGLAHCFEYAAYLAPVSAALLRAGRAAADAAWQPRPLRWLPRDSTFRNLARRPPPEQQTDERGYVESRLFTGFTHVALCIDPGDDVEDAKRRLMPPKEGAKDEPDSEPVRFEYHGAIHFNWAACVVEPRSFDAPGEPPEEQIGRMLLCIQIAHALHGACDAFERLFRHEAIRQAEGYIKGEPGGLNHVELNRLRTLALAVVSLTSFAPVAVAEEDRRYFALYDARAKTAELHKVILERAEILLNVQQAEAAEEESGRQTFLGGVALLLTGFTMISVLADTWDFAKDADEWPAVRADRLAVLALTVLLLVVVFASIWRRAKRRSAARRR